VTPILIKITFHKTLTNKAGVSQCLKESSVRYRGGGSDIGTSIMTLNLLHILTVELGGVDRLMLLICPYSPQKMGV